MNDPKTFIERQIKKYNNLSPHNNSLSTVFNTIKNLSNKNLFSIMVSALAKSPNFAVASNKIPREEIIGQIESSIYRLSLQQADNIYTLIATTSAQTSIIKHYQTKATRSPRSEQEHGYYHFQPTKAVLQ